jgi:hypothetical protein
VIEGAASVSEGEVTGESKPSDWAFIYGAVEMVLPRIVIKLMDVCFTALSPALSDGARIRYRARQPLHGRTTVTAQLERNHNSPRGARRTS